MGLFVDAITGRNLKTVVNDNVDGAVDATDIQGVSAFVDLILKKVGGAKMTALRIWGHGYTDKPDGNVILGSDDLGLDNIESFRPSLSRLTTCFAQSARAELRGCQAAKGNGKEMMTKLAGIWQVKVYGSEKSQFLITWNPPVYAATPGGKCEPADGIEVFDKR